MKIKHWLIHKLGGMTQDDLYNQQRNIIRYQEGHVITYNTELMAYKEVVVSTEQLQDKLAIQMLDAVKDNMEIECTDCPETGMVKYRATLRMVKVK